MDGSPSAEKGEGRLRRKENTRLPNTHPTQCGIRVRHGFAGVRRGVGSSPPVIRDKSLMREIRTWGSVRGVSGNRYPYRERAEHVRQPEGESPFDSLMEAKS